MNNKNNIYKVLHAYTSVLGNILWCDNQEEIKDTISFLSTYLKSDINTWNFIKFDNEIKSTEFFQNRLIYIPEINENIMPKWFSELDRNMKVLECFFDYYFNIKSIKQAKDFIDAIHAFPSSIINPKWNAGSYWNNYLLPYASRWDKTFKEDFYVYFNSKDV
ncbi:MAG: hypothetical protein PHV95_10975 [Eubacteriales bacterium]|nr:hypothetical protein [Eubacteriales bacterium]